VRPHCFCRGRTYTCQVLSSRASSSPGPDAADGVHVGDAWDLLDELASASVDLILTSPPYWGLRDYGLDHNEDVLAEWTSAGGQPGDPPSYEWYRNHGGLLGLEPLPLWYAAHLTEIFRRARRVLKPGGNLWLNLGDTYFGRWASIRPTGRQGLANGTRGRRRVPSGGYRKDKQLLLIPSRVAIALQEDSWILRNDLIWVKPGTMPRPERDRLRMSHEHFFHFVLRPPRGRASYYYDLEAAEPGGQDVVSVRPVPGSDGHSATFPPTLITPRIESSCPPGGLVLDPFAGIGRTLAAAIRSGRRAVGFELSPEFAAAASANVAQACREVGFVDFGASPASTDR
jgi:site-specific DNA-methyltransferase (cytosine-N4-specific)